MWSNHYWYVIGDIANQVEKENQTNEELVRKMIYGICSYVPCEQCRSHFKSYVVKNPIDVKNLNNWVQKYRMSTQPKKGCCGKARITGNTSIMKKMQSLKK